MSVVLMRRHTNDDLPSLTTRQAAIASYRTNAARLSEIAVMLLQAGDTERAKEAARYADCALRAAISERDNREPRGLLG